MVLDYIERLGYVLRRSRHSPLLLVEVARNSSRQLPCLDVGQDVALLDALRAYRVNVLLWLDFATWG